LLARVLSNYFMCCKSSVWFCIWTEIGVIQTWKIRSFLKNWSLSIRIRYR